MKLLTFFIPCVIIDNDMDNQELLQEPIKLKHPHDIKNVDLPALFERYLANPLTAEKYLNDTSETKYIFWDKAKYFEPIPGFTPTESWALAHQLRQLTSKPTPIKTEQGIFFSYHRMNYIDEALRDIDMHAGGLLLSGEPSRVVESQRQKYLVRGIVEESISSSQLEGADTSSRYAKKMIAENIKPRNKSDQMILNNYLVMQQIEQKYKDEPLSISMLRELQSELVYKTLSPEFTPGNFRRDSDNIVVSYDDKIAHTPPSATFVAKELERLVSYANNNEKFVHPVIKAIQLHFWIGYLHPFPDGNGRLARAVFYWYLFRHNYWAMAYLPVSTLLKRSPKKYTYAYVYSEQDNYDFSYFLDFHLKTILKAIEKFKEYIEQKTEESESIISKITAKYPSLNSRQVSALHHLLNDGKNYTSAKSYSMLNSITRRTAYSDLKKLKRLNLVKVETVDQVTHYYASDKLKTIF